VSGTLEGSKPLPEKRTKETAGPDFGNLKVSSRWAHAAMSSRGGGRRGLRRKRGRRL